MSQGRIVFMGTPDFSVPVLAKLCDCGFDVVGVVTQPDKPAGRKRILTPPPVKMEAERRGIPVIQPLRVRKAEALAAIEAWRPDVLVTCAYGQLLPQALLDLPSIGSLNVHASLLPRWRGAAPIQRSIMAGDAQTGIAIMEMVAALDAGPVYGMRTVPIHVEDNFGAVHDRLATVGAELLAELLPGYLQRSLNGIPQDEAGVTYAHRIERNDEWICWSNNRMTVHNHVRGLCPWPGAATRLEQEVVKVWATSLAAPDKPLAAPGTVTRAGDSVLVCCGDGWLVLREVQPAGKRRMSANDWFRGIKQDVVQFTDHADVEKVDHP